MTCTASYTITQGDLDERLGDQHRLGWAQDPRSHPSDTETVTAVQTPKLTLVKTATPATYDAVGDVISYSYTLKQQRECDAERRRTP